MNITSKKIQRNVWGLYFRSKNLFSSFSFYDLPFSTEAKFIKENKTIEAFRVMDENGDIINKKYENIEK